MMSESMPRSALSGLGNPGIMLNGFDGAISRRMSSRRIKHSLIIAGDKATLMSGFSPSAWYNKSSHMLSL